MNFIEKITNFIVMRTVALYGGMQIEKYYSKAENADKVSEKLLMKLLKKSRDTEFGKKYNFADIKNAEDYQKKCRFRSMKIIRNI